jgi:hypothetical protein
MRWNISPCWCSRSEVTGEVELELGADDDELPLLLAPCEEPKPPLRFSGSELVLKIGGAMVASNPCNTISRAHQSITENLKAMRVIIIWTALSHH